MAVVTGLNQEDKDKQQASSQPAVINAGSQPPPGMAPGGAAPGKPVSSGRFTNIQSFLKANKGAGQQLGGALTSNINKEAGQFQSQIGQLGAVTGDIGKETENVQKTAGLASQFKSADDIQKLASDDSQVAAFQKGLAGTTGAGQFQAQGQDILNRSQSELGDVQRKAALTGSEAGRFELLRQSLGRPSYSRGQQKLDQTLLQTGGNLDELQKQAAQQAQAGQTLYGTQSEGLTTALGGLTGAAADTSKQLKDALGGLADPTKPDSKGTGAYGLLQQQLESKAASDRATGEANLKRVQTALESGDLSSISEELGYTPGQALYGVNVKDIINPSFSGNNITAQSVATAKDLSTFQALNKLAGTNNDYLKTAGTGSNLNVINDAQKKNLQNRINEAKTSYEAELGRDTSLDSANEGIMARYMREINNTGQYGREEWGAPTNITGKNPTQLAEAFVRDIETRQPQIQAAINQGGSPLKSQLFSDIMNWYNRYNSMLNRKPGK